jgi:predicted nucleic acid-binding protein
VGLTVLDASILIAVLDADDAHHGAARAGLAARLEQGDSFVVPVTAYAEALVGALAQGEQAVQTVDAFIDALPARIEPATELIGREAARLRATYGTRLKLPDAFVIATGIQLAADRVLTADGGWPKLDVEVQVLRSA